MALHSTFVYSERDTAKLQRDTCWSIITNLVVVGWIFEAISAPVTVGLPGACVPVPTIGPNPVCTNQGPQGPPLRVKIPQYSERTC